MALFTTKQNKTEQNKKQQVKEKKALYWLFYIMKHKNYVSMAFKTWLLWCEDSAREAQ